MASKRRLRRKACGNKRHFADAKSAKTAMIGMINGTRTDFFYKVYKCNFCKKFHYGRTRQTGPFIAVKVR